MDRAGAKTVGECRVRPPAGPAVGNSGLPRRAAGLAANAREISDSPARRVVRCRAAGAPGKLPAVRRMSAQQCRGLGLRSAGAWAGVPFGRPGK